ncbi:tyrosyl-tRNA synthetase [Seinonella peptonophila]|uniref:Tyrosine--tRNA ligase n=1 Tax=Seinonella peptonophila TaxID=112248 RepID=A0A1M4VMQ4_9BACL|nr:tyrosine--tRNA ligase [Seinonella peptonophila]SHE70336.1 tyrosyl-tRNA synthetase [Seinonella peptonophila]
MERPLQNQYEEIIRGTVEVLPEGLLYKKLQQSVEKGQPLKIKLGIDPTAPDIHLGHTVLFQKLRTFQQFGHIVQLVIGDFTAQIGDPSGRSQTRKQLTHKEVNHYAETYVEQLFKVLDREKTEIHYNSEWLSSLSLSEVTQLAAKCTVARMLERDDFAKRYQSGQAISVHEFLYPLMQGYDSVALKCDVEIGGTDQTFNLLMGRQLQREFTDLEDQQVVLTMPLLEGLDGERKMSKSYGNYIGIDEPADEIYGKVMSIPDELLNKYFLLTTDLSNEECKQIEEGLTKNQLHPMEVKKKLAATLVRMYHSQEAAVQAATRFQTLFQNRTLPDQIEEKTWTGKAEGVWIIDLLRELGLAATGGEGRRAVQQGAVRIDGEKYTDVEARVSVKDGMVVQIGKRRIRRIRR